MIPDHIIATAARAAYEINRVGKRARLEWEDLDRYTQDEYLKNARAALEAVAADIWDEGHDAGRSEDEGGGRINHNPYERNEHA